jgi:plasmid stabilization system protein ParE
MAKLIWTDLALEDLDGIGNYIAQNSERFARLTIKQIYDKTELLKQFPKLGRG